MTYKEFFKNKKITLMGLGLLGRGTGDARFLAKYARDLIITDLKKPDELEQSIKQLKKFKNIKFILGRHRIKDFQSTDLVVKGAGVPADSPYIKAAQESNVRVTMSTALFAKFFKETGNKLIGITGTRGKSTVAHMIYHSLKKSGISVLLGGNILGVSTLSQLEKMKKFNAAVLELDSWQLQGFGREKISPDIAVFTTLFRDHMNYYKNSMVRYLADKAQIFLNQKNENFLVVGEQAWPALKKYRARINSKVIHTSLSKMKFTLKIPGEHNIYNAHCAAEALRAFGLHEKQIKLGLESFCGVKGRLEFICQKRGVKFYNDTTATTPEAVIAALKALDVGKSSKIILIAGGSDKNLDVSKMAAEIKKRTKRVLLLSGTGTDNIKDKLKGTKIFSNLKEAVTEAFGSAQKGDCVLLSPGFASFGMFKNEYDRGEQYNKIVKCL